MKYITRKGIVLCEIADQKLLIAASHLRNEVPYITILNDTGAFCWKHLEEGIDEKDLCHQIEEKFEIDEDDSVAEDIHFLIEMLYKKNYIQEI